MNPKRQILKAAPRAAFTLVELLVVMMVIAILAGITVSVSKYVAWRSRTVKAGMERLKIQSALEEYRSVYGEYPIVGDPNHYPSCFDPDPETSPNLPPGFRKLDLVNTRVGTNIVDWDDPATINVSAPRGVENLPFVSYTGVRGGMQSSVLKVDFRLAYPLTQRPLNAGRPPFMDFPKVTVCFVAWKHVLDARSTDHVGTNVYFMGRAKSKVYREYVKGDPVNRYVAIDPETGRQWGYYSADGRTYILTNGAASVSGQNVGSVD